MNQITQILGEGESPTLKCSSKKTAATKLRQIHFYFLLSFRLVSSRHSHNCYIENFTYIFIKKNNRSVTQQASSVTQITLTEKI